MKVKMTLLLIVMLLTAGTSLARAEESDVRTDRSRYERLMREVGKIDTEHNTVLKQAVSEAKKDGKTTLETKSRLLSLSEKRDRIVNQLTLLALRNTWPLPGANPKANASPVPTERERVFESADQMIRERFAKEAKRIANTIALPVISLESQKLKEKKRK